MPGPWGPLPAVREGFRVWNSSLLITPGTLLHALQPWSWCMDGSVWGDLGASLGEEALAWPARNQVDRGGLSREKAGWGAGRPRVQGIPCHKSAEGLGQVTSAPDLAFSF